VPLHTKVQELPTSSHVFTHVRRDKRDPPPQGTLVHDTFATRHARRLHYAQALHGVMAQMGLAMLGIELVRAFLLLSLAANLTHSFSLTSHICFNRFSKTRSLPCFKSCGRSDECNQHAIPVQQQGQPSSRRFFFHRAIRGISAAVVSNTVFRSSSFAEEVNNLKLTDIYFGVGCFWHIQHEFGKQEMKFNYQVRLYFSTICSSLISF